MVVAGIWGCGKQYKQKSSRLIQDSTILLEQYEMNSSNQSNCTRRIDAALAEFMADFHQRCEAPDQVVGIRTGFTDLDLHISGMRPGSLIVAADRPCMGLYGFSLNIATHVALEQGLPVIMISMGRSDMVVASRILGLVGKIDNIKLRTGRFKDKDWHNLGIAQEKLSKAEMYIHEEAGLNTNQICSIVRGFYAKHGPLGLVVVDSFDLMDVVETSNNCREIMRSLKNLAQEVNAPVVVLSTISGRLENRKNKRPLLTDLTYVEVAYDADVVMFLYRDEVYYPNSPDQGTTEIIISKNRWGPIGTVRLRLNSEYDGLENIAL